MSKRSRDPLDDPRSGPSKNALRGLSYVGQQPKFLQNIGAALSGRAPASRPEVPTRPEGDDAGDFSDDELDGATVVVLKEGKHIDQDEVDRLRAHAKATDALDPFVAGAAEPERVKSSGSLSFSSGGAGAKGAASRGKGASGAGQGDWADVVKRSKEDDEGAGGAGAAGGKAAAPAPPPAKTAEDKAREEEKEAKRKKKEKKAAKQKIGKLSFGEDE
ncbi:hypothetical protein DMC30DRAFT_388212 [Rhodotorula diobovata]|uniref:DUF4604 domain-containing protein n=1 Tax=Rhodotorula diobovata TaxID=5288 RepID=A0A5C5G4D3_9BASI|nr:hypothetical protein DMC30DRAFT_388212 [Rhodotorula diobovata]